MSIAQPFRRIPSVIWLLATILLISTPPAFAAAGIWTPLGPDSASVYALAVHPRNPRILYAGTEAWGVFKSVDGGATWRSSNAGLGTGSPDVWIRALVIDPRDPDNIYAASLSGRGVFRSENGGRSWAPASQGLPRAGAGFHGIDSLILDPRSPRTLYAGSLGGVFRSTNGGRTWTPRRSGLPAGRTISALALDRSTGVLYAGGGLGRLYRSADQGKSWRTSDSGIPRSAPILSLTIDPGESRRLLAGTTAGLFRSTDAGRSWKRVLPAEEVVEAVIFQASRLAYAGTLQSGVFRSDDGGATWAPGTERITDPQILSLASGHQTVYAGTFGKRQPGGVFRSRDHGDTWEPIQRGLSTVLVEEIAVDPSDPDVLYASAGQLGLFKSSDGGAHWEALDLGLPPGPMVNISSLAIDPARPSTIHAASRTVAPLLRSDDGGETWQAFGSPSSLSFEDLALDPRAPGALWAAAWGGLYHSEDEGATWVLQPLQPQEYFQFQDIQADPRDPRLLYVSGAAVYGHRIVQLRPRIFRSTDGGQTWERRDTGLADADGRIVDLVLDPADPSTLYASKSGALYRSTDAGLSWSPLPSLQSNVTALAAAPSSPPALYAAQLGNGVLRSTDQGETWTPIRRDLGLHPVLVLRPDPHDPERIFAGTANGSIFTYTAPDQ